MTAAIPPGNEDLFRMALGLGMRFTPMDAETVVAVKERRLAGKPLFRLPMNGRAARAYRVNA